MSNEAYIIFLAFIAVFSAVIAIKINHTHSSFGNILNIIVLPIITVGVILFITLVNSVGINTLSERQIAEVIALLVSMVVVSTITHKTGHRGLIVSLSLVPVINSLVLIYLALTPWPISHKK